MGERFYLPWKNKDWLSKETYLSCSKRDTLLIGVAAVKIFFLFSFFLLLDTLSQKNINAAIKSASGRRTTITFTPRYFYVITQ